MAAGLCHKFDAAFVLSIAVMASGLFFQGCQNQIDTASFHDRAPSSVIPESVCIDIQGSVLGDIMPGSDVFLYKTESLGYRDVMVHIKTQNPIMSETINGAKGFKFRCLYPGNYAFVILTSSYNGSVGSPLPYEFDCRNLSLRIAFQGGDVHYAVGAFSINETIQNKRTCSENIVSCLGQKGLLYRECSVDLS